MDGWKGTSRHKIINIKNWCTTFNIPAFAHMSPTPDIHANISKDYYDIFIKNCSELFYLQSSN